MQSTTSSITVVWHSLRKCYSLRKILYFGPDTEFARAFWAILLEKARPSMALGRVYQIIEQAYLRSVAK